VLRGFHGGRGAIAITRQTDREDKIEMQKRNLMCLLFILIIGLAACNETADYSFSSSSGSSMHTSSTPPVSSSPPIETSSAPPEEIGESSPYWWTPPEKPILEAISDAEYWEKQFWYIFNAYTDEYEWGDVPGLNSNHVLWGGNQPRMNGFVPLLYRDGIISQLEKSIDGKMQNVILKLEDFNALTSLYFGPDFADSIIPENADLYGISGEEQWLDVKYDNGKFLIPFTDRYTEPSTNRGLKFEKAIPLEDDLSRVELVASSYNIVWGREGEDDSLFLSSTHSYILRWDGRVGYVPERITWEYVPTDRVSLSGDNIEQIPVLWGNAEPTGYAYQAYEGQADAITPYSPIHVNGENVYQFRLEENTILYDTINLETLAQSTDNTLISANSEPTNVIWHVGNGIAVFADNSLYQFDGSMNLQKHINMPESIPMERESAVIDEQFTTVAYIIDNDLYLYNFEQVESRHIYTHVYEDGDSAINGQWNSLYPVRFSREGDILIGIDGWEARAYQYLLISQQGEKLAVMDWHVSGEHSGGYSFSNSAGAFHDHGYDDSTGWRYINFSNRELKDISYMPFSFGGGAGMMAIPAQQNSHQWYFSKPSEPLEMPDETVFYHVDFNTETYTELPFKVIGARASLMAASESGRLMFNYAYNGERGYGVYTPSNAIT
jgi:hypothetical protein